MADSLYDRFSGQARKVVQLACAEAQRRECDYVGTEHLLVALFREGSTGVGKVLTARGMDPQVIREKVDLLLPPRSCSVQWNQLPLTPAVKRVFACAREEASRLNHPCVGPEHLLLGMLREADGVAGHILGHLGLVLEDMRAALKQLPAPENRDWMLQPSAASGAPVALDPPPRTLESLATEEPIPRRVAPDPPNVPRDEVETAIAREEVGPLLRLEKQRVSGRPKGRGDEEDLRPWEQRGNFRRDVEPYHGYVAHTLAWFALACAVLGLLMTPLACIGLLVSRCAWAYAEHDIDRMRRGVLDPTGMDSAKRALRLAQGAGVANAVSLLLCVSVILGFVVWVSRN